MRIKVRVRTSKVGSACEDVIELNDEDYKNEDGSLDMEAIDEAARDAMSNMMEWGWEEVE